VRERLWHDEEDDEDIDPRSIRLHRPGTSDGGASLALTFGIIGVAFNTVGLLACSLALPLGLIMGIIAWIRGQRAISAIESGRAERVYRGTASTARILGMSATGLPLAWILLFVVIFRLLNLP
jgi:hypothetical protein